ncbi:MAG: enolase C-terminal domain-like protein [Bryobacteraceae bacterium]
MKITSIETIPVRVPIRPEFQIRSSLGAHLVSPFLILRVHTDEGITGVGEVSCTPVWSGEDQVSAANMIRQYIEPSLTGEDPRQIEALTMKMRRVVAANPFTKSGVEMALWDILGKSAGLPVYRMLGGAVRPRVPVKMSISGAEPERAARLAEFALSQGLRASKVKVAIAEEADVARVKAARQVFGEKFPLGVDANGGWSARVAIRMIRRLADECGIYFAEQPVAPLDTAWMADVRRNVPVPVMADESVYTLQDAMALVRAGAADILSVYVGKGGGIGPARKIAAVAEAAGLTCTVGSNLELGIASAAMAHLAMATPGIGAEEFPCDILGPIAYEDDVVMDRLKIEDGGVRPADLPGLGVELDEAKLARYKV